MLFNILRGNTSGIEIIAGLFATAFVVFCTLPVHEFAHAWTATKLGDQTARLSGRLSLNPMRHLDPLGAIMIFLVGFGYAKPVPVNPRNFKNPKAGMALTALAGPGANLLMAALFILLRYILWALLPGTSVFVLAFSYFCIYAASINIGLAVFNLIPVPPLDGSRVLQLLIPSKYYFKFMQYERYIVIVVLVLLVTGALTRPLAYLRGLVYEGLDFIIGLPFR